MTPHIKILGGLGNQLFQYFFARSLSIKFNCLVKLDISEFISDNDKKRNLNLDILNSKLSFSKKRNLFSKLFKSVKEEDPYKFNKNIFNKKYFYYTGYWQSYKYFENNWKLFKEDLNFKNIDAKNKLFDNINDSNSISVHIRRGDYITDKRISRIHGNLQLDYYKNAICLIRKNILKPKFFFFSDDIKWVKNNFKDENFYYVNSENQELTKPFRDLFLMKNCKHNIIANSTFSWWGAWLNESSNKVVIAPKYWSSNRKSDTTDLIPARWIIL